MASAWRWGTRQVEITSVRLVDEAGHEQQAFQTGGCFALEIDYEAHEPVRSPIFGFAVHRHDGVHLTGPNTAQAGFGLPVIQGRGTLRYRTTRLALLEGLYEVSVAVVNENDTITYDFHNRLYTFRIANQERAGQTPGSGGEWRAEKNGLVSFLGSWEQA